jgi:hypothetical protein
VPGSSATAVGLVDAVSNEDDGAPGLRPRSPSSRFFLWDGCGRVFLVHRRLPVGRWREARVLVPPRRRQRRKRLGIGEEDNEKQSANIK